MSGHRKWSEIRQNRKRPTADEMHVRCEVCENGAAIGVAAIPGMPLSVAYCRECLQANAHPWWALVANTAGIGGLAHAAGWWVAMVDATCLRLGRSRAEFDDEVAAMLEREGWG